MRKVICAPLNLIPKNIDDNIKYFTAYSTSKCDGIGYFASTLMDDLVAAGISPSAKIWDFATIAFSVAAVDKAILRKNSPDGWTRQIDLTICLYEPLIWTPHKSELEKALRFLTGDFWNLTFTHGGQAPPQAKIERCYEDNNCISLLSGGLDSLIGAIDLVANGERPIFVSQVVHGEKTNQKKFALAVRNQSPHFQWSHKIHIPKGESESSTRGRSIVFLALAALAADAISHTRKNVSIFVPENGFISQNIPLNPGRIGSYSTKTTHPVYISEIQKIWDKLEFNMVLQMPYKFKTKGEMLVECKNKQLLNELIAKSVSCGKYGRHNSQHCGRCVPCMVRRAAFLYANMEDVTEKGYEFSSLKNTGLTKGPNDVGAMARACLFIEQYGIKRYIAGLLSFADYNDRENYKATIQRGFDEIICLLREQNVI